MEVNKKYRLFEEIDVTTLLIGVESCDSTPINFTLFIERRYCNMK
jgi:hypothetical protein